MSTPESTQKQGQIVSETKPLEIQGLLADPYSTVPEVVKEGKTIAIYDLVWRSGDGLLGSTNVRGYAHKSIRINRLETEDENYRYRQYKAYFIYDVQSAHGKDTLVNEYNCIGSEDEYTFSDFTFLKQGEHSEMEKPRVFFPKIPVQDSDGTPFMGLSMVYRNAPELQTIVAGWAKLRSSRRWTSEPAELDDKEYERLSDLEGYPKRVLRWEVFDPWF
ncbi:uncharacterized protein RSE6_07805 [Rhynchosporium secalis]|uniref:Uncharacterized protein n=1 Tax=Rhynchosporium secalis TaxID=38038 RepID=A0A1E1MDY7_RHYSE|nr:uncharacterized protein RSE6_07805 [Rhynchosporium secalis]